MQEARVLWLQLTGGEPMIDPLFADTHNRAWDMGMMIQISSNGSRLDQSLTLDILTQRPPYRLTLSIYGAVRRVVRRDDSPSRIVPPIHARA